MVASFTNPWFHRGTKQEPRYARRERRLSDHCRQEAAGTAHAHASGLSEKPDCMLLPWNCRSENC